MKIFEWGCGGSTLFFADRAETVTSIEHNEIWYSKLAGILTEKNILSVSLKLTIPSNDIDSEAMYYSDNELYQGQSFKNYVLEIERCSDEELDIILIDGRARNACFLHSVKKLKKGGILVWDNTERSRYRDFFKMNTSGFKRIELPGPTPFSRFFTLTTIFIKT
jgi:hypothetical protein